MGSDLRPDPPADDPPLVDPPFVDPRFIDVHPAVLWTAGADGRLSIMSGGLAEQLGLRGGDEPQAQIELVHPDDRQRFGARVAEARETGTIVDIEVRMRVADGGHRWMRVRTHFDRPSQQWFGTAEDVHDRREAEAALRVANDRLALALEGNNAWAWELDFATGRYWYSDGWKAVLGYADSEISGDVTDFERLVHPDDQQRIAAAHHAHVAGDAPVFEGDFRVRRRSGGWVWVHDRGRIIERDADGRPLRAIGVRTDITARKTAEAQARTREAQFKALLDNITDAVVAVAADGTRGFFNRAYAELYAEELGERDWADVAQLFTTFDILDADGVPIPDDQRPISRVFAGETVRDLDVRARVRHSGRVYRLVYNGQPVYGENGALELAVLSVRDVTAQQMTQAALLASEARFRGVFESGVVGMCIFDSRSGETLAINDRLLEMTGASREAFERGEWDWREVTPASMSFLDEEALDQIRRTGCYTPYEKAFVRPDGTRIDVKLSAAAMPGLPGHIASCIEDITERKRSQDQLRESEGRLEAIIESLEEGVVAIGPDRRVLFANAAFRRMLVASNAPPARFDTLDDAFALFQLYDPGGEILPVERRPMTRLLGGEPVPPTEGCARFADGREIHVVYRGQPILDEDGAITLAIMVVRDVTRERQADAHLKALQQELIHVSRVSAMGTMAASLAHELNQPLAAVANYSAAAQMMLAAPGVSISGVQGVLKRSADESVRAGQIVNRLRRFITKGEIERQRESLAAIVREAVAIAHSDDSIDGTQVKLKLDPDADDVVVDRIQLQQVVFNLVRNAVEAMAGGPRRELTIVTRRVEDQIELLVADRGPGLPAQVKERLFEPFITTKEAGMGIGLPICRSIVRAHGGDIRAEARPSGGTVFIVSLPRAAG
jgi:PAS domain S-box-containing protein